MHKTMNGNSVDRLFRLKTYHIVTTKGWLENIREIDWREVTFQNRVVTPLLDRLFVNEKDISIVDTSTQYENRNSDNT